LILRPEPVLLDDFLSALLAEMNPSARGASIRLELDRRTPDGLRILSDPLRLQQVLENLLANAIKFSPAESVVQLALRAEGQSLVWEVRDQGPGVPEDEQGRIFERFYRSPGTRAKPGTGLGLAIVKHLCRLMGGEVMVESRAGQGATFRVRLPLQRVPDTKLPSEK